MPNNHASSHQRSAGDLGFGDDESTDDDADTSRSGLRRVPLCPACHAALEGHEYKREMPEAAAKLLRRGAA